VAPATVGKPSGASVDRLVTRLRGDDSARKEAVALLRRNFASFVDTHFTLTDAQRACLRDPAVRKVNDVVGRAAAVALESGGKVTFRVARTRAARASAPAKFGLGFGMKARRADDAATRVHDLEITLG
jgi:hypothetical protein